MPVLYTLLGIILFIVILFSLKFTVIVDYGEKTEVKLKYLFITIPVVDTSKEKTEKKPAKNKKKKDNKKSSKKNNEAAQTVEETVQTESASEQNGAVEGGSASKGGKVKPQKQGNSLVKQLYIDQGYDGLEKMLRDLGRSLSGFFGKLYKTLTIDELYIKMVTVGSDAADTAVKHGKLCAGLYPILGKLISTCKVKKYDFDITPDFLAPKSTASAFVRLHIRPIKVTNAAVVLVLQLVFKILFKILFAKKKSDNSKKTPRTVKTEAVSPKVAEQGEKINK